MNISQMILSSVTPLSEYQPKRVSRKGLVKKPAGKNGGKNNVDLHYATVEKYKKAWGSDEWLRTKEIEKRLGMARCTSISTLNKWADVYSIIERRPFGGSFNRRHGFEWRWPK